MIAFGYEKDNDEEKLMKLSETTLQCNNEELDRIIDFLNRIKNTNYEAGDHYHYRDFNKKWTSEESDFIIFLEADFEVMDKITVTYTGTEKAEKVFADNADMIGTETLAVSVQKAEPAGYVKEWKINGENVTLGVAKM